MGAKAFFSLANVKFEEGFELPLRNSQQISLLAKGRSEAELEFYATELESENEWTWHTSFLSLTILNTVILLLFLTI